LINYIAGGSHADDHQRDKEKYFFHSKEEMFNLANIAIIFTKLLSMNGN
jgi:hypothetical protein